LDSKDERIAAIAAKSIKELTYHIKHTGEWMIRLGDGTEESHNRVQESVTDLVRFIDELFYQDEVDQTLVQASIIPDTSSFRKEFDANIKAVLDEATLSLPEKSWQLDGGRKGVHSEHLGYILTELQYVQRAYPGNKW
jgi:ring-1,2-phenylacetyl-CoA epoxidase subunit PaaC